MLRFTRTVLAAAKKTRQLTGYGLFIRQLKKDPALYGLSIGQRGKQMGRMWNSLPTAERKALSQKASKIRYTPKKRVRPARPQKAHQFRKFVKANMKKVDNLPREKRFKALSKMYKAARK